MGPKFLHLTWLYSLSYLYSVEAEYATKESELKERHAAEIAALQSGGSAAEAVPAEAAPGDEDVKDEAASAPPAAAMAPAEETEEEKRRKKQEKARKKKMDKKQRQLDAEKKREEEIEAERLAAGPSAKELEIRRMEELYLKPAGLRIMDVAADGHCLYRAVAEQCRGGEGEDCGDYRTVRSLCADALLRNEEEYAPFADVHDHGGGSYETYVERVRSSADWGGHLELRALSAALKRPVVVYSADAAPLKMGEEEKGKEILLSYHRHYYALGEHYNSVTKS